MAKKSDQRKKRNRTDGGTKRNAPARNGVSRSAAKSPLLADRADLWISLALSAITLAIYAQVLGHQFIKLDDDAYISDNPIVARGLTWSGIVWAFTTFHAANWHPLTWISHMLDAQLFGLNAGGHLFVNALIHVASTLLLFWFLRRATNSRWPSAMVAALFALHPLHVESVAWAAERKDTLAAFFGILALLAYARYVEATSRIRYALVALWLALGLMAKPMLVTWPIVFLLLDYWPFRRIDNATSFVRAWWPLIREKLPLLGLVAASMVVTFIAQSHGGTVRSWTDASLWLRVSNALVSYAKYFLATYWPGRLGVYYPFASTGIPSWQIVGAILLLAFLTAFSLREMRARPYLIVGWLWFLITLVPVIGLVQVGGQSMADRYYYLPSIGLFVALVFGAAELTVGRRINHTIVATAAAVVLVIFASLSAIQITQWRDSVTLFQRTLAVAPDNNLLIQHGLGYVLGEQGKYDEALVHFNEALRIKPDFYDALVNTGITLSKQGRTSEARTFFERALVVSPRSSEAHTQLALAFVAEDKKAEAAGEFRKALDLAPQDAAARTNFGLILARQGKLAEAMEQLSEAVRLDPNSAEAQNNLGLVLLASGRARESIPHFSAALRLKPDLTIAQENLRRAQARVSRSQP